MLVLTVVALRLIGIWLIATHIGGVVAFAASALNLSQSSMQDQIETIPMVAVAIASILPMLAGLFLLLFSGPLSRAIVPVRAHDLPTPTSVSAKTVTQIGVFLIGLWLVGVGLPVVVAIAPLGWSTSIEHVASLALGLVLILGSGLFAGLVGKLRNWP
jgi:hypothetical protein